MRYTIDVLHESKRKAKRQRDNWKHRAEVYRVALERIIEDPGCRNCTDNDPYCAVNVAKAAIQLAAKGVNV